MNIEILFLIFLIISTIMLFYIKFLLDKVIKKIKEEYYQKGLQSAFDYVLEQKYKKLFLTDKDNGGINE